MVARVDALDEDAFARCERCKIDLAAVLDAVAKRGAEHHIALAGIVWAGLVGAECPDDDIGKAVAVDIACR